MWRNASWCVGALLLAGCAGPSTSAPGVTADEVANEKRQQQTFQIQNYHAQSARLNNVAFRLTVANREDCRDAVGPRAGFNAISAADVPAATRELAIAALRLDPQRPTIVAVADSSPAAKAGLAPGDIIASIDGSPAPSSDTRAWLSRHLSDSAGKPLRVEISRQDKTRVVSISPVVACSIPVFLADDSSANAFTDGKRIVVHSAILRISQNDAQLAIVVGHELAHVTMAHLDKRQQNAAVGAVGGVAADVALAVFGVYTGGAFTRAGANAGAIAYAQDFEKEADYVGTYYAAKAGYDVTGAEQFWRALGQENPTSVAYAGLHPTTPERFVQMQKTVGEIGDKKRRMAVLRPEAKPQPVQVVSQREIGAQ